MCPQMWRSIIWGISISMGHLYCIRWTIHALLYHWRGRTSMPAARAVCCGAAGCRLSAFTLSVTWPAAGGAVKESSFSSLCEFSKPKKTSETNKRTKWIWALRHKRMKSLHCTKEAKLWHFNRILAPVALATRASSRNVILHTALLVTLIYCLYGVSPESSWSDAVWFGQDAGMVIDPPVSLSLSLSFSHRSNCVSGYDGGCLCVGRSGWQNRAQTDPSYISLHQQCLCFLLLLCPRIQLFPVLSSALRCGVNAHFHCLFYIYY